MFMVTFENPDHTYILAHNLTFESAYKFLVKLGIYQFEHTHQFSNHLLTELGVDVIFSESSAICLRDYDEQHVAVFEKDTWMGMLPSYAQ